MGQFRWSKDDHSTHTVYYGYGLLTHFFRGPSTVFATSSSDPMIRAAAIQHHEARTYSIAVINRYQGAAPLAIASAAHRVRRSSANMSMTRRECLSILSETATARGERCH